MNRIKSIQEIYNEAKAYDCVLTVDAALARGLNRLIHTPRFGVFAVTPRQLAQKYSDIHFDKIYSKFEFVNIVAKETDKPFRLVHALTENILNVWNQSGLLELTEIHLSDEVKELLPYFEKYPMLEYAVQSFNEDFFNNKKIAVIGKEFFNELDLQVLPKNIFYDEINILTSEDFSLGKTYVFGNTKTLIDNVVGLITRGNMNHSAIVLEPNSDYNVLLQTRLKENGIDVLVKTSYTENLIVRFMLGLIENSFGNDLLKAKDLKEAGKFFGFEIDSTMDNYNLEVVINSTKDKNLKALYKIMSDAGKFTFKKFTDELIDKFESTELNEFNVLLDKLSFFNENVTEENLIELKYILENFDVDLSSKRDGLLFVDAKNSAFVNREVVIYLGLDESWSISTNEKQYLDKNREDKINLKKFEILIQQGSERLYFTQEIKDNKEVLPAPYFSIIENRTIADFKDRIFNHEFISGENIPAVPLREINTEEEVETDEISIAPTGLKRFVLCPAKYFYDTVTPPTDAPHFLKGNLLHEFAELYFQHPDFCKENYAKIMDYILKKFSNVIMKSEIDIERTNFKIAMDNVMSFLNTNPIEKILLEQDVKTNNEMMESFKKKKIYDYTEKDLPKDFIVKGRVDLRDKKTIVDYKSGSNRYKVTDLPMLTNIDYIIGNEKTDFDFQAISYIAALQNENITGNKSTGNLKFIYNYVLANKKNLLDERLRVENNLTEFTYIDLNFVQYLLTENCYLYIKETIKPELRRYLDFLDFSGYKDIFEDVIEINFYDKESVVNNLSSKLIKAHQRAGLSFGDFNKKLEKVYLEDLYKLTAIFYRIRCNEGLIFKDDVKKFLDFVKEKLGELNSYRRSNFPASPIFESNQICKDCDYLNICKGNLLWN